MAALQIFPVEYVDDPACLDELADAAIGFLTRLTIQQRALRAAQPVTNGEPIEWLDAKGVAALLHRSESTVRHLPPDAIPGRRQAIKGGKVEWNRQQVLRWLAKGCPAATC